MQAIDLVLKSSIFSKQVLLRLCEILDPKLQSGKMALGVSLSSVLLKLKERDGYRSLTYLQFIM
jgi:hypothetical protein